MHTLTSEECFRIIEHLLCEINLKQTVLATEMGLTRSAMNKILKGKQKMYISDFFSMLFRLKPSINDYFYGDKETSTRKETSQQYVLSQKDLLLGITTEDWNSSIELIQQIRNYLKSECVISNQDDYAYEFCMFVKRLNDLFKEKGADFNAATYAEYLRLKNYEYQYILNLSDIQS